MTQEHSTSNHKLFIDGQEVLSSSSGQISFPGNNQINTLSAKISDVDLQNKSLFNKKIELYLNESGMEDTMPIFTPGWLLSSFAVAIFGVVAFARFSTAKGLH